MLHFDFKRGSRKCFESDKPFQPGEKFFSALIESDQGPAERRDFSVEHWDGPPENCIGWWAARVPEAGKKRVYWAPGHVMLSYFDHIQGQPNSADVAFVTALLLVQKKLLMLDDDEGDESKLKLRNRTDKTNYEIPVVEVSTQRLAVIQEELSERLFMDQPVETNEPDEPNDGPESDNHDD